MMLRRSLLVAGALVAVYAQEQACLKNPPVFNVSSTTEAAVLAKAAACPNALIRAFWQGKVQLRKTIRVGRGSSLTVSGEDTESAIIDGGGKLQLFDVGPRGNLTLIDMTLTNGFADTANGGAVSIGPFATLRVMVCVFSDNCVYPWRRHVE
jgi:hypothetical protein